MDLICRADWPHSSKNVTLGHNGRANCVWSSLNLVAFTTERTEKGYVVQYLNIFNPNLFWDIFSIPYTNGEITCMSWNHSGRKLLVGDLSGNYSVWLMKDHMSNLWYCSSSFEKSSQIVLGEEILAVSWLHTGIRIPFKTESANSSSKRFRPSLNSFGGKPVEGLIAVTSTGRVAIDICDKSNKQVITYQLNVSCHQELADIAFTKDGKIKLILSDGNIKHLIRSFDLKLKFDSQNKILCIINVAASLALESTKENQYSFISHVKFVTRETHDHLLVCVSTANKSTLESWLLRQKEVPLHRVFHQSSVTYPSQVVLDWKFVIRSEEMFRVKNFSVAPIAVNTGSADTKLAEDTQFYCGLCIAVVLSDNTIQLRHRVYMRRLFTYQHNSTIENMNKKMKLQAQPLQLVLFSPMSCALVAFEETGSVLFFRVPPWLNHLGRPQGQLGSLQICQLTQLLLHCLISGCDWWDILLNIDAKIVGEVVERLMVEFKKMPAANQECFLTKHETMRITLYHVSKSCAATDLYLKSMLRAITLVFRSLILPQNRVTNEENDPAMKLESSCNHSLETDVDNLVHNLDADPQTLQSMQQLIQWVADVVLYILASVPYYKDAARPGHTLFNDRNFLSLLRENLVLIRVWSLLKQACSPLFTILDVDLDVVSHAFKLTTLLWQTTLEEVASKDILPKLISECSLLQMKVVIPPIVPVVPPNSTVYHKSIKNTPLRFTFEKSEPDISLNEGRLKQRDYVQVVSSRSSKVDMLRWLFLGDSNRLPLKQCTRCGVCSLLSSQQKPPVKIWEQRFISHCLCGGIWRKTRKQDSAVI